MKRALVISLSYRNTDYVQLNNGEYLAKALHQAEYDVKTISDIDQPQLCTKAGVLFELSKLMASGADEMWFHFSGHGRQVRGFSRDEPDGLDEAILCTDSYIRDSVLKKTVYQAGDASRVVCTFGSCTSGTMMDLPISWDISTSKPTGQVDTAGPKVICLSAAVDGDTIRNDGALSTTYPQFIAKIVYGLLQNESIFTVLKNIRTGYQTDTSTKTVPLLTSNRAIGTSETLLVAIGVVATLLVAVLAATARGALALKRKYA